MIVSEKLSKIMRHSILKKTWTNTNKLLGKDGWIGTKTG